MNPSSNFNSLWEPRDFNENEYVSLLNGIANKDEGSTLMVDDNSIKVVGNVMKVWQTIKGWFGFENKTDPIKVNYEMLKILRYGESHHYLQNENITPLLKKLQQTLAKEKSYEKIATIIGEVLLDKSRDIATRDNALDTEIRTYQTVHRNELNEPFWLRIFPRYFAGVKADEAHLLYNRGRILASSKEYEEAIKALEKATQLYTDPEWQLLLAKTYIHNAERCPPNEALDNYNKALKVLQSIDLKKSGGLFLQDYRETEWRANTKQCVSLARLGKFEQAVQAVKNCNISDEYLFNRDLDPILWRELTPWQYGKLQVALSRDEFFKGYSNELLARGIDLLYIAVKEKADSATSEELIDACVTLGNRYLQEGQLDDAEDFVNEAHYHFNFYKSYSPAAESSPVLNRLTAATNALADHLKAQRDFRGAIRILEKLELLTEHDSAARAQIHFTLAQIEQSEGRDVVALIEAQKADHLSPKGQYQRLIDEITEKLAKSRDMQLPEKLIDDLVTNLEQLVTDMPKNLAQNHLLAKAYLCKVEQLCKENNFPQANLLIDQALNHLAKFERIEKDEQRQAQIAAMMLQAYEYKIGIQLKLNEPTLAVRTLKVAAGVTNTNYKSILEDFYTGIVLLTKPSQEQLGRFYQQLAVDPDYTTDARQNLSMAAERLVGALHEKFDERISEQLILSMLEVSSLCMAEGDLEKAEEVLRHVQEQINRLKEGAPRAPSLPALNSKVLVAAQILTNHYETKAKDAVIAKNHVLETRNLQGAIRLLQWLKELTANNRGEQAGHCFALAKLERQRGNFYDALIEAERAQALDPSKEKYRALIDQMEGETETQKLLADNYFRGKSYDKALKCYLNCFRSELEKYPNKRDEIVGKMIQLGDLVKEKNSTLACKAYEAAAPYFEMLMLAPKKKTEIYQLLGDEEQRSGNYAKAISHYQELLKYRPDDLEIIKLLARGCRSNGDWQNAEIYLQQAIQLSPRDGSLVFDLGHLYEEQNRFDKALSSYRKAYELDPENANYRNKLVEVLVEAGDQFLAKGDSDPKLAHDTIIKIRTYIESKPELASNFHRTLKGWLGETADNRDFRNLGKNVTKPIEIEAHAKRAVEIINKAYDGEGYHFKPELMPQELRNLIQELQLQIAGMRGYYDKLRQSTQELVEIAHAGKFAEQQLNTWKPIGTIQDLASAEKVKEEATRILHIIDESILASGVIVPSELRVKADQLRRLLGSYSMAEAAIPHYLSAAEIGKDQYGSYINKMIQAYVQIGDYRNAILAYDKYKEKFPQHPIQRVPSVAYMKIMNDHLSLQQYREAADFITKAVRQFPDDNHLKEAQMKVVYKTAEIELGKGNKTEAFRRYQELLSAGVKLPAECYYKLSQLYISGIQENINLSTNQELGKGQDLEDYQTQAVQLLKKAADLSPTNAAYHFQCGKYIYWYEGIPTQYDALIYIQKAHELDKSNLDYAHAYYTMLTRRKADKDEIAFARFELEQLDPSPEHAAADWPEIYARWRQY